MSGAPESRPSTASATPSDEASVQARCAHAPAARSRGRRRPRARHRRCAFNLLLDQRLTANAIALAKAQAEARVAALTVVKGTLTELEAPGAAQTIGSPSWVFAGRKAIDTPRVAAAITDAAAALASGPQHAARVKETMQLYAVPVVHRGTRVGTVVAGVPLAPYDETATTAFVGSVLLAVLLLVAVAVVTHWILGRALLPVSRMTEDAAAWSDHDLDRRFDLGEPYDELTRLAATLDSLLGRLSAGLRHEQRFTAELSHELRTPLARIAAEAELALRKERSGGDYRASLEAVQRNAEQMRRTVEALVSAARQEAGHDRSSCNAAAGIRAAVAAVREDAEASGIELIVAVPAAPVGSPSRTSCWNESSIRCSTMRFNTARRQSRSS